MCRSAEPKKEIIGVIDQSAESTNEATTKNAHPFCRKEGIPIGGYKIHGTATAENIKRKENLFTSKTCCGAKLNTRGSRKRKERKKNLMQTD